MERATAGLTPAERTQASALLKKLGLSALALLEQGDPQPAQTAGDHGILP